MGFQVSKNFGWTDWQGGMVIISCLFATGNGHGQHDCALSSADEVISERWCKADDNTEGFGRNIIDRCGGTQKGCAHPWAPCGVTQIRFEDNQNVGSPHLSFTMSHIRHLIYDIWYMGLVAFNACHSNAIANALSSQIKPDA